MFKEGDLVKINSPDYVAGAQGYLFAREEETGRWLVRLLENNIDETSEPVLVSLETDEFELIEPATQKSLENVIKKDKFLFPRSSYQGKFTVENLIFDANLQEFSQKVGYICALETGGKLSSKEAYDEIKALWKQLKKSKKRLGIGEPPEEKQGDSENKGDKPE
jgi:hypothetical protein